MIIPMFKLVNLQILRPFHGLSGGNIFQAIKAEISIFLGSS